MRDLRAHHVPSCLFRRVDLNLKLLQIVNSTVLPIKEQLIKIHGIIILWEVKDHVL